jgi:uncharacterized membrane protein YdjX (TVP38/TMEM64 family)
LLGAVAFILITIALIVGIQAIGLDRIRSTIEQAGPLAPLVYIIVKLLTYVFAPLSSGPIQLSAGILFGLWPGTIYTLIGEVIGGSISFWIARKLGRPIVRRLVGEDGLRRVDSFYETVGEWRSLLYARLFLFSIYDFISYAAGFTPLKFRTYVIISVAAGFIPTFIAVALGTTLTEERSGLILVYALVGIACAVPLLMHKRIRRWLKIETTHRSPQA